MAPDYLQELRDCCRDETAFGRLQQILLALKLGDRSVERTAELLETNQKLLQEITDRKWTTKALQESEQRFRSLIENATDIIVILGPDGSFRYSSPSAQRLLGYTSEDVEGHPAAEFIHPDDVGTIYQVIAQSLEAPGVSQPAVEYRVRHQTGSWCIFEAVTTNLLDDSAIQGIVVNCHDITERKQAEDALRSANHQIASILESITDAFISLDHQWRLTYLNQRATQLFQRSAEQLMYCSIWEVFSEIGNTIFDQEFHRAVEQQTPVTFEALHPTLPVWFEVRAFPSAEGLSVFFLDVTERRQAQAELLEMSSALGNAVEGIARLDIHDRFIGLNRAFAASLSYEAPDLVGAFWQQVVYPDDWEIVAAAQRKLAADSKAEVEVRAVRRDCSTFYMQLVMVPAYDWHDHPVGYHYFTKDITERKQAEETQRQQSERERLMGTIAGRIRQSLDLEEILNTTVSEVRQFLRADRVVIVRIQPEQVGLVTAESVEEGIPSMLLGLPLQADWFKQWQQQVYQAGNNWVLDDRRQLEASEAYKEHLHRWQIESSLSVPILHSNQLWGILEAHQCSAAHAWETLEIGLLEQLATQVAIAIQQSELYQQVQVLNAGLERQVQDRTTQLQQALQFEATLKRIIDSVRDSLDEDQILQTAVQELAHGLDVWGCHAALYDLKQQTTTVSYECLNSDQLAAIKGTIISLTEDQPIYRRLLRAQQVHICRIEAHPATALQNRACVLLCPIVDDQDVLGNLCLMKPSSDCFSEQETRLVQQVADQCAIAMRQARLYQKAQTQVAVLEELNELKDDFLSTVSHELRTPVSNMKMAIHMLRNAFTPERQETYLNILQTECSREIDLINDLLDLQRLDAASYPVLREAVPLAASIESLILPFQNRTTDRQQIFTIQTPPQLPTIQTDRAALERVLAELLNNACKYTPPQGEIRLTVEVGNQAIDQSLVQLIFVVSNQAEIPAPELGRIFEKFYRVPKADPWKQGGTGLGLALVQRLVAQLNGSIDVASGAGWTTFTVNLLDCPKL